MYVLRFCFRSWSWRTSLSYTKSGADGRGERIELLHKDIDIGSPVADEHSHFYGADLGKSAGGMIPHPAFGDTELVGDLPRVQQTLIVVVVQCGVFVCLVEVTAYALNSEFNRRSIRGSNN